MSLGGEASLVHAAASTCGSRVGTEHRETEGPLYAFQHLFDWFFSPLGVCAIFYRGGEKHGSSDLEKSAYATMKHTT